MLSYIEYYIYMRVFTFFSIIVVCCSEYLLVGHLSNLVGRLPMSDSSLQHKIQKISAAGVLPELNKLRLRQIGQNSGSGTPAPVHSTTLFIYLFYYHLKSNKISKKMALLIKNCFAVFHVP